ncbi:MAG: J domain-containing protein [Spirochaetota bacterium]
MPMERNPFLAYLHTHRSAGAPELKELFRLLAKRTHPDTSSRNASAFAELQDHYHAALTLLIERSEQHRRTGAAERGPEAPPRDRVLSSLYRYKALLPSLQIDGRDLPPACAAAFAAAVTAAEQYTARASEALAAYDEQFHRRRPDIAVFPEIRVKYPIFLNALSSFFDYQLMPNDFNLRVARSYLAEIRPVTDVDPAASPHMRHNRSAPARSALYRMRVWLEEELELPVADLI